MLLVSRLPHGQEGKGSGLGAGGEDGKSRPEPLLSPALMSLHIRRLNANSWHFLVKICMSSMFRIRPFPINRKETIPLWSSPALSRGGFIYPFPVPCRAWSFGWGAASLNSKRGLPVDTDTPAPIPFLHSGSEFPRRLVLTRAPSPILATRRLLWPPSPPSYPLPRGEGPGYEASGRETAAQEAGPQSWVSQPAREPLFPGRHFGSLFTSRRGAPRQHGCHRPRLTAAPSPAPSASGGCGPRRGPPSRLPASAALTIWG